jgi:hypothetical protein
MSSKSTKSCVVLVPYVGHIEPACENGLRELERRGYEVRRLPGHSDIARGRSMIATCALHDGFDDLLWIDSDIAFSADSVEALRAHDVTIVGGVYPQKGRRRLCVNPVQRPVTLTFGEGGGLVEVVHVATGFLLTRRAAYEAIERHHKLPRCKGEGPGIIPFFASLIHGTPETGFEYLSEDYSFCERARSANHKIYADTSIRLGHVGAHEYSWEDAGSARKTFATYNYTFAA